MVIDYVPSARARSAPAPDDLCVPVFEHGVLLLPDTDGGWRLPTMDLVATGPDSEAGADIAALGTVHGQPVWAATMPASHTTELVRVDWAACLAQPDAGLTMLAARAIAVMTWRRTHRFCGACGTALIEIDWAVARKCPSCGVVTFAKAQPVALVAVWRHGAAGGREVLLARHTYGAMHFWALVGGYVDPAETLEQAAHREVAEEVGLRITDLTYFGSEAWGLNGPGVLLTVYLARCPDADAVPVVDGHELAEADFFPVDNLPTPTPPTHLIAAQALIHLATHP